MALLNTVRPLAETFYVTNTTYPYGVYISSVDLCFSSVELDRQLPIYVEIRPTENGIPSTKSVLPNALCTRYGSDYGNKSKFVYPVPAGKLPNFLDETVYTRFVFDSPVYLVPGQYALVVRSDSSKFVTYAATLGANQLVEDGATPRLITQQPYAGKLFRAQVISGGIESWEARPDQDLMFRLNRCHFNNDKETIVYMTPSKKIGHYSVGADGTRGGMVNNFGYDEFYFRADDMTPGIGSSILYNYASKPKGGSISSTYTRFSPNMKKMFLGTRQEIVKDGDSTADFVVSAEISTPSRVHAPAFHIDRVGLIAIKNIVNNAQISNNDFVIVNGGAGYTEGDTINVISVKSGTFGANDAVW